MTKSIWKGIEVEVEVCGEEFEWSCCDDYEHDLSIMHHVDSDGKHYCPTEYLICLRCNGVADEPESFECNKWGEKQKMAKKKLYDSSPMIVFCCDFCDVIAFSMGETPEDWVSIYIQKSPTEMSYTNIVMCQFHAQEMKKETSLFTQDKNDKNIENQYSRR